MRRALLTAGVGASWPDVVGSVGRTGGAVDLGAFQVIICGGTGAGATARTVMKSARAAFTTTAATNLLFFSGSLSGTTFTVRDVAPLVTLAGGTAAIWTGAVGPLKFEAGDFMGVHQTGSRSITASFPTTGASAHYITSGAATPTPGTVYTVASFASYGVSLSAANP